MKTILATLAALMALASSAFAHDGVHIQNAYARVSPQSAGVFFTVLNHAASPERLISASTDVADKAELHTTTMTADGVMQMAALPDGVAIAPKDSHAFTRGGDHIMLMGLKTTLKDGDHFTLTLSFEHAGTVQVDVVVDNSRKAEGAAMGGMNMGAGASMPGMTDAEMAAHTGHTSP